MEEIRRKQQELIDKISILEKGVEEHDNDIKQLVIAIRGNDITKDGGLVQRLDNLAKSLETLNGQLQPIKDVIERAKWSFYLMLLLSAFFGWVIDKVMDYFKN